MNKSLLSVERLVKRYGGLVASDNISFEVHDGIHAIIGPNGAGKSTLIAQLSGELPPDSGRLLFEGTDVTDSNASSRCRMGIARSYQITSIFPGSTALQNVATAVQVSRGHSFRFWSPASADASIIEAAHGLLDSVGLNGREKAIASNLAHGEQRQLELAMTLATGARLLLLDEPMAGLGAEESVRMTELLRSVSASKTIVMVEHDMDAVFALATRISVLVSGRIIVTGNPSEIRSNREVQQAYLGEGDLP